MTPPSPPAARMEAIAAGKGRKPKPFMLQGGKVEADAVWDSRNGLAAEERKAEGAERKSQSAVRPPIFPISSPRSSARPWRARRRETAGCTRSSSTATASRCACVDGEATLKTRKGLDWTAKYPAIARAAGNLPDAIIDGEICALDENGAPDFAALAGRAFRRQDRCARLFRLRPAVRRRRGSARAAADRAQGAACSSFCPTPATMPAFASSSISRPAARRFCARPAGCRSKASSRSAPMRPTSPAAPTPGRSRNAARGMRSSSAAMPRPTANSARCWSASTAATTSSMSAASARAMARQGQGRCCRS